jgi:hypothetical protein
MWPQGNSVITVAMIKGERESTDVSEEYISTFRFEGQAKEKIRQPLVSTFFRIFSFDLFFNPEYGGDMFLRIVG